MSGLQAFGLLVTMMGVALILAEPVCSMLIRWGIE